MKVATRLALGFGVVIILLVAISVLGMQRLEKVNAGLAMVTEDRYPKVARAQRQCATHYRRRPRPARHAADERCRRTGPPAQAHGR
nr:MCP four helix bundle domain-containing protein [Achromobacter aloeverae]